ncbi:MAG TPA: glycosyltransferase family 4 protein [Vitreimonas sp.]|jgi:glycosyltransferase involved in cell wall biosynthesis|nr:glycosyltransferase family 4 protein [Vitreimonas sp.]
MDTSRSTGSLRVALVSPPMLPVPPPTYAGTERVVAALGDALMRAGHEVTLFAPGDSTFEGEVVPTIDNSLWRSGYDGDVSAYMQLSVAKAWKEHARFDIIHAHAEIHGFPFARYCPTPVVTTLHGRLDAWGLPELLEEFRDIPLVAISDSQRRWNPHANWVATIHHGLSLEHMPFGPEPGEYLAFVGRVTPEKGVDQAIELARSADLTLRMAAKVHDAHEHQHFDEVVQPAVEDGTVEFLGELGPLERDPLYAGARATIMLGAWPEPFGLVAIESLATGTPVIARRAGALTETIEHGVDGFLVDDITEARLALERVHELDRARIRKRAIERFSPDRMADDYLRVYRSILDERARNVSPPPDLITAASRS